MNLLKVNFFIAISMLMLFTPKAISQKNYPIPPSDQNLLFYIQRNHNENTIIFDANFDKNGNLNTDNPIDVYWIRYQEQGQRMELRYIERKFADGVTCNKIESSENLFEVKIAAKSSKYFRLKQIAPFKAVVHTKIKNKIAILDHIYVQSDNTSFWPRVSFYEQFGRHQSNGNYIYGKVIVN